MWVSTEEWGQGGTLRVTGGGWDWEGGRQENGGRRILCWGDRILANAPTGEGESRTRTRRRRLGLGEV